MKWCTCPRSFNIKGLLTAGCIQRRKNSYAWDSGEMRKGKKLGCGVCARRMVVIDLKRVLCRTDLREI